MLKIEKGQIQIVRCGTATIKTDLSVSVSAFREALQDTAEVSEDLFLSDFIGLTQRNHAQGTVDFCYLECKVCLQETYGFFLIIVCMCEGGYCLSKPMKRI